MNNYLCILCNYFYFYAGVEGYSEMTPGWNAEMGCNKDYWKLDNFKDTTESYRKKLEKARKCKYYENHIVKKLSQ